jgi:CRP-like cAMP-binding protein
VYIVRAGVVEVSVGAAENEAGSQAIVRLGEGQVVGEIALIDRGPRSATVRCVSEMCLLLVIERAAFEALCASDHHIGLVVYRNLAADLAFKLRHRHLTGR